MATVALGWNVLNVGSAFRHSLSCLFPSTTIKSSSRFLSSSVAALAAGTVLMSLAPDLQHSRKSSPCCLLVFNKLFSIKTNINFFLSTVVWGKHDRRTKKGKRYLGTFGKCRPRNPEVSPYSKRFYNLQLQWNRGSGSPRSSPWILFSTPDYGCDDDNFSGSVIPVRGQLIHIDRLLRIGRQMCSSTYVVENLPAYMRFALKSTQNE